MSRLSMNQIINTFFPTLILWFFGYSTLFIDPGEHNFNNRFMGAGTSLLVVVTLLNAVKGDLPKTAYIKLIDIWFLWHVVSILTIIVYHIILHRIRMHLIPQTNVDADYFDEQHNDVGDLTEVSKNKIRNINNALTLSYPILHLLFYMCYIYIKLN